MRSNENLFIAYSFQISWDNWIKSIHHILPYQKLEEILLKKRSCSPKIQSFLVSISHAKCYVESTMIVSLSWASPANYVQITGKLQLYCRSGPCFAHKLSQKIWDCRINSWANTWNLGCTAVLLKNVKGGCLRHRWKKTMKLVIYITWLEIISNNLLQDVENVIATIERVKAVLPPGTNQNDQIVFLEYWVLYIRVNLGYWPII